MKKDLIGSWLGFSPKDFRKVKDVWKMGCGTYLVMFNDNDSCTTLTPGLYKELCDMDDLGQLLWQDLEQRLEKDI